MQGQILRILRYKGGDHRHKENILEMLYSQQLQTLS